MTDAKTTISTRLLKALAGIAYDGYERPNINCILFRGGEIFATDGHRLVRVPFEHHTDFCMPRDLALSAVAAMQARGTGRTVFDMFGNEYDDSPTELTIGLANDGKSVWIDIGGVTLHADARDIASFPPTDKIFSDKQSESGNSMGYHFNPNLLAGLWDVIEAYEGANHGAAMVSCGSATDPMVYRSEAGITFALMPMRAPHKAKEAA